MYIPTPTTGTPAQQHTTKTKPAPAAAWRRASTALCMAASKMPVWQAAQATGSVLPAQDSLRRARLRGPRNRAGGQRTRAEQARPIAEVLIPGMACVPSSIKTSSIHGHFSSLTSRWWLLFWHHEQEQAFNSPACRYAQAASAEPQLQCSCAAQERTRKNCQDCLWALYHKPRFEIRFLGCQNPTCANNF